MAYGILDNEVVIIVFTTTFDCEGVAECVDDCVCVADTVIFGVGVNVTVGVTAVAAYTPVAITKTPCTQIA